MIQYFRNIEVGEIGQIFCQILRKPSENRYSPEILSEW